MTIYSYRKTASVISYSLCGVICILALIAAAPGSAVADDTRPLMRFPDIHDTLIVFVYGEDIWRASSEGGVAVRLTMNDGEERFPMFSPDGSLIAFTGEYDGNDDIYVMNVYGGDITRVTYHPGADIVVGWHPVKNKILFRSYRNSPAGSARLFLIAPDGTGLEELILHEASIGSYSPNGAKIAYNKISREHRTWKRYQGGTAQDIYIYDFESGVNEVITDFAGTDRTPMWIGNNIYFLSDRDGILDIHVYDTETGDIRRITDHDEYDVRRPNMGGDRIVYELGGELWVLDTQSEQTRKVPVEIRADRPEVRPYRKQVKENITHFDISPAGERAAIVARGEVFTVPREDGPTRNLTNNTGGARSRGAVWSPDGRWIAYISDDRGEYEIYVTKPDGSEPPRRLSGHESGYRHTLRWSPDSKKIAFADQTLRCFYLNVDTRKITEIDKADYEDVDVSLDNKPINDYAWSPDSRYIAYSKMDSDLVYHLYIYSLAENTSRRVSTGLFNDFGPVFTPDGEHLLFISNRRFSPTFCDFEWEMVYKNAAGIYALTLQKDGDPFLPFKNDEVEYESGSSSDAEKQSSGTVTVSIDFDDIIDRVEMLPLPAGNYRRLSMNDSTVFYLNADSGDFNRFEYRRIGPRTLWAFSLSEREQKPVIDRIDDYRLSADGTHIVYRRNNKLGIIKSTKRGEKRARVTEEDSLKYEHDEHELDLSDLEMWLDPLAEWRQMFNEAWRMERDFYYEPNMHGLDWEAVREKYASQLPNASCRQDIRFIIGEMIAELSTSHTYVYGGDRRRKAEAVNVGMLGVDWIEDSKAGRYRFGKIYRVPDWTREVMPPLTRPGVNVDEGDYLIRVNHREVTTDSNIYNYFQDLAGEQVTVLVNSRPSAEGAREYVVKPLSSERILRYLDWVEHNRQVAEQESGGLIGYMHLPDTYTGSAREFPKYFYSQTRKKGLIIDGRYNGGGLDPDIFLQRLDKGLLAYWTRRYSHDQTTPAVATRAHMVCLTNRQAGSGGDMLPWEFQKRGIGPVIGTRTWGGLVGLSMWIGLVDGGGMSAPDYRIYDTDGRWIVENEGVQPDIVVDNQPNEMARGYDAQLMKAIEVLMEEIEADPRPWPEHEPFPVDTLADPHIRKSGTE